MGDQGLLERDGSAWLLPLNGLRVSQVRVDYCFGIELAETEERAVDRPWRIRISTAFTFSNPESDSVTLDPEGKSPLLGPALSLRHAVVADARVWADGRLRVAFVDGSVVEVMPHPQYEAWEAVELTDDAPHLLYAPMVPDTVDWNGHSYNA